MGRFISKSLRTAALSAALLAIVLPACGGGGGGGDGNSNPVAPPGPGPTVVSGNVRGSVVGFNNPSNLFAGTEVELVGVGTTSINAKGEFGFDDVPAGEQRLEFNGPNHLQRRVNINVSQSGRNEFSGIELVESAPFDVDSFDEIYRDFQVDGTVRWNRKPTRVLLDRDSLSKLPQGMAFFEREVKRAYNGWLPANTDRFFAGTRVVTGSIGNIDPEAFDCSDVPAGEVHIVGIEECPIQEVFVVLGQATHCFNSVGNEVVLAAIFFNPCTSEGTIEHEIIHTMCAGHLSSKPGASVMAPSGGPESITALDRRHLRYLYTRPAGTVTPDDSWGLQAISPD